MQHTCILFRDFSHSYGGGGGRKEAIIGVRYWTPNILGFNICDINDHGDNTNHKRWAYIFTCLCSFHTYHDSTTIGIVVLIVDQSGLSYPILSDRIIS